ncbi:FxSxx-COOH cyclophane-containing RiPP peptide [Phytohabitans sp. LJ34]|uniref:FxSxx-COOH cyclophane-containing RiPP peptide n=1 Tax=Phytohabitans sp. LJ34 TaxID=3452217 RepID=UPI003F8B653F
MSDNGQKLIPTAMVDAAHRPLRELLALRESGDSALDHCLRRVAEEAANGSRNRVAAFNACLPRPS